MAGQRGCRAARWPQRLRGAERLGRRICAARERAANARPARARPTTTATARRAPIRTPAAASSGLTLETGAGRAGPALPRHGAGARLRHAPHRRQHERRRPPHRAHRDVRRRRRRTRCWLQRARRRARLRHPPRRRGGRGHARRGAARRRRPRGAFADPPRRSGGDGARRAGAIAARAQSASFPRRQVPRLSRLFTTTMRAPRPDGRCCRRAAYPRHPLPCRQGTPHAHADPAHGIEAAVARRRERGRCSSPTPTCASRPTSSAGRCRSSSRRSCRKCCARASAITARRAHPVKSDKRPRLHQHAARGQRRVRWHRSRCAGHRAADRVAVLASPRAEHRAAPRAPCCCSRISKAHGQAWSGCCAWPGR